MTHVLDACAILAYLYDERGSAAVGKLFRKHARGQIALGTHGVNICEVYYHALREDGSEVAEAILRDLEELDLRVERTLPNPLIRRAGYFKTKYRVSLGDAVVLAFAALSQAKLVTCDHHEMDTIDASREVGFHWIR